MKENNKKNTSNTVAETNDTAKTTADTFVAASTAGNTVTATANAKASGTNATATSASTPSPESTPASATTTTAASSAAASTSTDTSPDPYSYKIPKEIDDKIPEYFYYAFAGELFSIYGPGLFKPWEETCRDGSPYYDLDSSSARWDLAFRQTCVKLGMHWLLDYYHTLGWYNGDRFDGIVEWRIILRVCRGWDNPEYDHCSYGDYVLKSLEPPYIPR